MAREAGLDSRSRRRQSLNDDEEDIVDKFVEQGLGGWIGLA